MQICHMWDNSFKTSYFFTRLKKIIFIFKKNIVALGKHRAMEICYHNIAEKVSTQHLYIKIIKAYAESYLLI